MNQPMAVNADLFVRADARQTIQQIATQLHLSAGENFSIKKSVAKKGRRKMKPAPNSSPLRASSLVLCMYLPVTITAELKSVFVTHRPLFVFVTSSFSIFPHSHLFKCFLFPFRFFSRKRIPFFFCS
jgi:hypothetical protein